MHCIFILLSFSLSQVNGKMLKDKIVFVGKFKKKEDHEGEVGEKKFTNIFVKNLDGEWPLHASGMQYEDVVSGMIAEENVQPMFEL